MKNAFIVLLGLALFIPTTHAIEAQVKGFIALDLLVFKHTKRPDKNDSLQTGIGVLDLKLYGTHEDFDSKIKLDLDDSSLEEKYNLFEEVTVGYKFLPTVKLTAGKGVVPFHRLHWGVIENTFRDGGSVLGVDNAWRDVDQKILLSLRLGSFRSGLINEFTFWGESKQPRKDRFGSPVIDGRGDIEYENSKTFETRHERGFANKIEFFPAKGHSAGVAALYYQNDLSPDESYAFDAGYRFRTPALEIWSEYTYGRMSTHPGDRYATLKTNEHLYQVGFEKYLTQLFNFLVNVEYADVGDIRHNSSDVSKSRNDGLKHEVNITKTEAGVKIKTAKSAFVTVGALYELKKQKLSGVKKADEKAWELATKLSFWF